jgi:predicted amidohydrolase
MKPMRALLAAINCPKGEIDTNLARHVSFLREAADSECDIAVFPEMSLTGYINPETQADRSAALDSDAVLELAEETGRTGVSALFGIAERTREERILITQVFASGGRVAGSYSKRHLGESEEGFHVGESSSIFSLNGIRFGAAICAESDVAYPFGEPAADGATVVFHCSAPGLWGQRENEADWQDGFDWWHGECLERLSAHARDHGLWIAATGQAGSTVDEDFPGWAGLFDPTGRLVTELPDWREATLIVDIPVEGR